MPELERFKTVERDVDLDEKQLNDRKLCLLGLGTQTLAARGRNMKDAQSFIDRESEVRK